MGVSPGRCQGPRCLAGGCCLRTRQGSLALSDPVWCFASGNFGGFPRTGHKGGLSGSPGKSEAGPASCWPH